MISIVMPVKNAAKYLDSSIESIIDQNHKNWELIAVDDHSTDSSFEILQKFSKKDSRIHVLPNQGSGIIQALRTAYAASKGEYIHRMDADDLMPEYKLRQLLHLLNKNGNGTVATGKVQYFAEGGVNDGYRKYESWLNSLCENNTHWSEIYKECVIASPCWMLHRTDFDKCGGFFSNLYPEDYDLVFRFYSEKFKVVSSDMVLHLWRDHAERTSRNHKHYAAQSFYHLKLKYFLELEYDPQKKLVIWGAGQKGKRMAKMLKEKNIPFRWTSNNPNKHGKNIYNKILFDLEESLEGEVQVIITVAQRNAKSQIRKFLNQKSLQENRDFWFFS